MSRLPRHLEHLRTGFTAEAASAATFRAFAEQAEAEGKPNLARRWRELAAAKDRVAIDLLIAAGEVGEEAANLRVAIAEEQYENEVLYPRLIGEMRLLGRSQELRALERVVEAQEGHLRELDGLRRGLTSSTGDVEELEVAQVRG
ncbi:MAG TPA: hypothetical protein VMT16_13055 [Thermoanaerobaculia bacterium]|nr:hypothetical protein [Thermoanaerobaculia bacterium]